MTHNPEIKHIKNKQNLTMKSSVKHFIPRKHNFLRVFYFFIGFCNAFFIFVANKDLQKYGASIRDINILLFIIYLPWQIKFIFGFVSDNIPIWGYHRKSYIIFSYVISAIFSGIMALAPMTLSTYVTLLTMLQVSIVIGDVACDAIMVEEGRHELAEDRGNTQLDLSILRTIGYGSGAVLGARAYEILTNPEDVYLVEMIIFICLFLVSVFLPEKQQETNRVLAITEHNEVDYLDGMNSPSTELDENGGGIGDTAHQENIKIVENTLYGQFRMIVQTLKSPVLRPLLIYDTITSILPSPELPMFYFLVDVIHITPTTIGTLSMIGSIIRVVGTFAYKRWGRNIRIRQSYIMLGLISAIFSLFPLILAIDIQYPGIARCGSRNITETPNYYANSLLTNNTQKIATSCFIYESISLNPYGFLISEDVIESMIGVFQSLPITIILTMVCKNAVEASTYSTVLAFQNATSGIQQITNALFIQLFAIDHNKFENLPYMLITCSMLKFLSLFYVPKTPNRSIKDIASEIDERENEQQPT